MFISLFKQLFFSKGDRATPNRPSFQAFILEPILTPSGIVNIGDDIIDVDITGDDVEFLNAQTDTSPVFTSTPLDLDQFEEIPFIEIPPTLETAEQFDSGVFAVDDSGEVTIDFLFDGGKFKGELAIFSLENMGEFEPGSREFIQEAADRALSNSDRGYVVIRDKIEGARFSGELGEKSWNSGEYLGEKTFQMQAGDEFGVMFVPNGTVEKLAENPDRTGSSRPLFSLSTANSDDSLQMGQIADVTGESSTFVFEDMQIDGRSDRDYNDFIFRVKGATGDAIDLDKVIDLDNDWRGTEDGQEILYYIEIEDAISPLPVDPETGVEYKPGELLVKLAADIKDSDIQELIEHYDAIDIERLIPDTASSDSPLHQWRLLTFEPETNVLEIRDEMLAFGDIEASEVNAVRPLTWQPNDTDFEHLWALNNTGQNGGTSDADIDATEAWDIQRGSKDIVVAVIDTGVDYNHEDFNGNMWRNLGEIAGNGIDDDGNGYVDDIYGYDFGNNDADPMDEILPLVFFGNGHGTHVAGIIGAAGDNDLGVVGVSPNVSLMALGVRNNVDSMNSGKSVLSVAAISESIRYAVDNGANIINASLGGQDYSQLEYDAISYANDNGVLLVASAGNASADNDLTNVYPANYNLPNIISVAATDDKDNLAYLSNFGANTVELAAPGTQKFSTMPGNNYEGKDGTSMAAPYVTGAAALLLAENKDLSHIEMKNILLQTSEKLNSLDNKTVSEGRLNLYNAVQTVPWNLDWTQPVDNIETDHSALLTIDNEDNVYIGVRHPLQGDRAVRYTSQGDLFSNSFTSDVVGIDDSGNIYTLVDNQIAKYDKDGVLLWQGLNDFKIFSESFEYTGISYSVDNFMKSMQFSDPNSSPFLDIDSLLLSGGYVDKSGNIYTTATGSNYGWTWMFKHDTDGNLIWTKSLYTTFTEFSHNVYSATDDETVVSVYDRAGNILSTYIANYFGSSPSDWESWNAQNIDFADSIANVDNSGNIYTVRRTGSPYSGDTLSKYDRDGNLIWDYELDLAIDESNYSKYKSDPDRTNDRFREIENSQSVAIDSVGNVYVTGSTRSFLGENSEYNPISGPQEPCIAKYDENCNLQWRKTLTDLDWTQSSGIVLDEHDNVYLSGWRETSSNITESFVIKYDPQGNRRWTEELTTQKENNQTLGIQIDRNENIYVLGTGFDTNDNLNQELWLKKINQ
ncbi:MAG: S8 family serine peptidase [Cyanobacteria bacterium P01_E01_bin.42]